MLHIFIVVDSGGNLLGSHLLGKACRDDICVLGLGRAYGYEKVSLWGAGFFEPGDACGRDGQRHKIQSVRGVGEFISIGVEDYDVMIFF